MAKLIAKAFLAALLSIAAAPAAAEASAGIRTLSVGRPDGSAVVYHLSRRASRGRQGVILMFQGSGCEPVAGSAAIAAAAPLVAPGRALVTVEKYGVPAEAGALVDGCSPDYWRRATLSQRVLDALHVVAAVRRERWWNGEVLLFGGSEGGAVAAMLAPLVPETRAVIVFSSGIGQPVGEMIRSAIPPQMAAEAPRVFAEARLRPGGGERWGGASYAWWADAVDLVPARSLLMTDAPILLVHGTADRSAPVASARATRDLLAAAGRHNFTYREYEGYSHAMVDVSGVDRRSEVLADVGAWLRRLPWDRR